MDLEDKKSDYMIFFLVIAVVALIVISMAIKKEPEGTDDYEENVLGSGFLEVDTFPSNADIFVDKEYKGKSPDVLYGIPVGEHKITIEKEGYDIFEIYVSIEAGKKAFVDAALVHEKIFEERPGITDIIVEEEAVEKEEEIEIELPKEGLEAGDNINIGRGLLLYYDFSERKFTENKQPESDIFSRRFGTYFVFTRYSPASIKEIDKSIDEVKKEDCMEVNGQFEYLHSGKSLCITTKDDQTIALGGYWENTKDAELMFKTFN